MPRRRVDGKKLGIDWARAEKSLSGHHRTDELLNANLMNVAQKQLQDAIRDGRYSAAKKLRVAINHALEARLALRASWCPTCLAPLTKCQCPDFPIKHEPPPDELIARIQARIAEEDMDRKEANKARRKQERLQARKNRKLGVV